MKIENTTVESTVSLIVRSRAIRIQSGFKQYFILSYIITNF